MRRCTCKRRDVGRRSFVEIVDPDCPTHKRTPTDRLRGHRKIIGPHSPYADSRIESATDAQRRLYEE